MVKFSDEHKEESQGNFFGQGVHKVLIMLVEFGKTDDDKEFGEFTVVDPENDDRQDRVRLWFTTDKAVKFSFSTLRNIFVHNAPEDKKDSVREKFNALEDTKQLEEACQKTLIGKECWYTVYEDPERTYTNDKGEVKNSYNRNIYGYEPKPRTVSVSSEVEDVELDKKVDGAADPGLTDKDQPFGF